MQQDINSKTITSVADGYEAFILQNRVSAEKPLLYIASNGTNLAQTAHMLSYLNPQLKVMEFPAWDTVPYDRVSPNSTIMAKRIETLSAILFNDGKKPLIIVSSIGAIMQKLPPAKIFRNAQKKIKVGGKLDFDAFLHYAAINGYNRVEQVMEAGEYAVRGDIADIFPSDAENPLRIDLFDDEVERIRFFDPFNQRTIGELQEYNFQVANEVILDSDTIRCFRKKYRENFGADGMHDDIYENISNAVKYMGMENWLPFFYEDKLPTIFDYLPNISVVVGKKVQEALEAKCESIIDYYKARLEALQIKNAQNMEEAYRPIAPELLYLTTKEFADICQQHEVVYLSGLNASEDKNTVDAQTISGRDFVHVRNISGSAVYEELNKYLQENKSKNRIICCYSEA